MGTVETSVAPAASGAVAPPTGKPQAAVVQKVPQYRRLDMQCVVRLAKLDPASVDTANLPERIQRLGQNVFLASADVFAPGALVGFELNVPNRKESYRAKGVVRWISDDPKGFGLQLFEVASEKAASAVQPAPNVASAPVEAPSAGFALPEVAAVSELISGLLGKTIEAKPIERWEPTADKPAMVAAFGTDDGPTTCLWIFDLNASIYAGAALTMMPHEEAAQAVQAKKLRDSFVENVREIFNVGSSLFSSSSGASVKLKEAYVSSKEMPDIVKQLMARTSNRLDLEINVPDYGKGHLSVIVS